MCQNALRTSVRHRRDMEYARTLTATPLNETRALEYGIWDASSFCEAPSVEASSGPIFSLLQISY